MGAAFLAYMLSVTLIITLLPFRFEIPQQWRVVIVGDMHDALANILLFVPLGFFYCFARAQYLPSMLGVAVASALLSTAIELTQLFESARITSPADIAMNSIGGGLGAFMAARVRRSSVKPERLVGWLSLELPLMALIYLLVPLLWISTLALCDEPECAAAPLLIGTCGAILLGGIQRNYFGPARAAPAGLTATLAALWFAAGAFPMLRWSTVAVLLGSAGVWVVTWLYGATLIRPGQPNRRFELRLLITVLPFYLTFVALIVIAPMRELAAWHAGFGLPQFTTREEILRLLELLAAFTLLGYIAAESKGRDHYYFGDALIWILAWALAAAGVTEFALGFDAASGGSVLRFALLVAAALYGGWLYHLQRAHVMALLARASR